MIDETWKGAVRITVVSHTRCAGGSERIFATAAMSGLADTSSPSRLSAIAPTRS